MYEIEIKILDIDRKKVEENLVSLGAKKVFDGEIHALYYDSQGGSLREKKDTLRLRREGDRCVLTYKGYIQNSDAKVREEKEVEVSDFDKMRTILELSGFSVWLEMKKHRTSYEYEGAHFELDKYHGAYEYIPDFIEIEGRDIGVIYKYAELIGFRKEDCRPWDSLQVAEYYRTRL